MAPEGPGGGHDRWQREGLNVTLLGGDADGDNYVNASDFLILRKAYGSKLGDPNYDARADFDEDGQINATDFLLMRKNYGTQGDL